ncbi:MAG: carboxylesterase family protein [Rubrobacter sp.]|nr:carboxylesterase family protein [Rubrobacter sp.]
MISGDLLAVIRSDWYIRIPVIRVADAHATSSAATYMYEFAWRSPQFDGRLDVCHGSEIAFVFDTLGYETEPLGERTLCTTLLTPMHAASVSFATSREVR